MHLAQSFQEQIMKIKHKNNENYKKNSKIKQIVVNKYYKKVSVTLQK